MTSEGLRQPTNSAARLGLLACQLSGFLAAVRVFELENRTVFRLLVLSAVAACVHAILPRASRLPFFAALSIASVGVVLGPVPAAAVILLGCLLIAACHLPVPAVLRGALLTVIGAALWLARPSEAFGRLPGIVIPVLASMLMFRLVLYFNAVRHGQAPSGLVWSLAYMFMLPNVVYPLFPVVDYGTMVRTHYDGDAFRIYDRGMRYLLRGLSHLLVYRLVFYDFALDSSYLNTLGDVVQYIVTTFLLYVNVSGQFHLVMGLLGLFGFRLPETNHLYFLATSPVDFWRRINIYWKDFMLKLVYYPSILRLRRFGTSVAIVTATLAVFFVTWFLHGYQFYWLQGGRLFGSRDMAFWGGFGILVVLVTLWETRAGRRPVSKIARRWSLGRGLSTVATFATIAVLWSVWNAASGPSWLFMWTRTQYASLVTYLALGGAGLAAILLSGFAWGAPTLDPPPTDAEPLGRTAKRAVARMAWLGLAMTTQLPALSRALPSRVAAVADHLRGVGFSAASVASVQAGYYEQLVRPGAHLAEPWEQPVQHDRDWRALLQERADFLTIAMAPAETTTFIGARLTTNAWGMRGPPTSLAKPTGTYRIAFLGPSDVMGWGVGDSETLPMQLQSRLGRTGAAEKVQVLNFGIPSYGIAQQVIRLEWEGLRFSPDLVLLTVHPYDLVHLQENLRLVLARRYAIPDTALVRILRRVGIGPGRSGNLADLRVVEEELDRWAFSRARALAASIGASFAVVALRTPDVMVGGNLATTERAARSVGVPYLDCTDVWQGVDVRAYALSAEDGHPNPAGISRLAACLVDQLRLRSLGAPSRSGPPGAPVAAPRTTGRRRT